jgi:hypothetical protein
VSVKILYHDRCFDGMASAAVFSRFYQERVSREVDIVYQGLAHQAGEVFQPGIFSGEDNIVVDFRYSRDPKLTWWFDHHQSAFPTPADRAHFEADRSGHKFYDPKAKSCTKFMADTLIRRFGFNTSALKELIHWADIIDGAQFTDARMAVELKEPALQLMLLVEGLSDEAQRHQIIRDFQRLSLEELVRAPYVQEPLKPLLEAHQATVEIFRREAQVSGGVVRFDLTPHGLETFNKFIGYYLFPEALYSVGVTRSGTRAKVSLGSNPWKQERRTHDLSKIAERFGGGGHPAVAAISFPPDQLERAQQAAGEIAAELAG